MTILIYLTLVFATTPYQQGPIIHCDIYPLPNGGFYEQCYTVTPPPVPDPTPTPDPGTLLFR